MDTSVHKEKNRGRIETRTAFTTDDVARLPGRREWPGPCCIGALHTEVGEKGRKQVNGIIMATPYNPPQWKG